MTIYGWDASHYDAVPAAAAVIGAGFKFMTHKIGGDANDAEAAPWWAEFKEHRDQLLLGGYWVLRPDLTPNPAKSADAFLDRLDAVCAGWRDAELILQADCEEWQGSAATKPAPTYIKAFCNRLQARMPKLVPFVYASAGQYGNSLNGLGYPLWNARYVLNDKAGTAAGLYARCGGDSGSGWNAYSGQTPAIWQYTSSAVIDGQATSDANAYRGTLAELTAQAAPGWVNDVTTQDEVLAALKTFFTLGKQPDGSPDSMPGQAALAQGIPNPFLPTGSPKSTTWQLLGDIAEALAVTQKSLDGITAALAAAAQVTIPQAQLELAVLNALKTLAGGQS